MPLVEVFSPAIKKAVKEQNELIGGEPAFLHAYMMLADELEH